MNRAQEIWQKVLCLMENTMTKTTINTWFDEVTAVAMDGDTLVLSTPSQFKREIIAQRYLKPVESALKDLFSEDLKAEILSPEEAEHFTPRGQSSPFLPGTEGYTFDTFVVGSSNRFAFLATKKAAENPGLSYNPLFIYGSSGLGKTHLLYAAARAIHASHPAWRILYIKSETFVNELVQNLRSQENYMQSFREKYRNVDVFLMDDVQFIAGKNASEEELFHTFNTLYESKKQIIFTSDRPPKELLRLEERLQTRFEWGLPVDIQPPDYETRLAIIKDNAFRRGVNLPDPVLQYVAENITNNVRQIEGTVSKILALQELMGAQVDVDTVIRAVRDMLADKSELYPSPESIITEVAAFYELEGEAIRGQGQTRITSTARNVAMYLMREMTDMSLADIGGQFSGRHYTTVISSVKGVEGKLKTDPNLKEIIQDIRSAINGKFC